MGFSGENQLLTNPIIPRIHSIPDMTHTTDHDFPLYTRPSDDFKLDEEVLIKKRKILEEKAPGLFDYLTRLTAEEISTETASSHSCEHEGEDSKHSTHIQSFYIPTPFKSQQTLITNSSLSNTIKVKAQNSLADFSIPALPGTDTIGSVNNKKTDKNLNSEDLVEKQQQQQILQMITRMTMMMGGVCSQTSAIERLAFQGLEGMKQIKQIFGESEKTPLEKIEQNKEDKKNSTNYDSDPTPQTLFNHLFGSLNMYKYELVLDCELPVPIFRERNLIIKAKLVDIFTKEQVRNQNKVLMHLALQTWEVPSNPILRNKTGNKAIMGETEVELKDGEVIFDRIQINEVTSKFIHGYVAMLIIPAKPVNYGTSMTDHGQGERYISFEQIKPLMLEKIVVKSKKKKNLKKKNE